jgi:hypothetical protein
VKSKNTEKDNNRLKESNAREKLLKPLHSLEAKIFELCSKIKTQLRETVTYCGIPYSEKMKTDYISIVKKCCKKKY